MTKSIWKPEKAEVDENVALSPKRLDLDYFMSYFFQILKEQLIFSLFKCFQDIEKEEKLPGNADKEPNKENIERKYRSQL